VGEGRLLPRAAEQVGRAGLDWVELPGRLEHDRIRELFSASSLYLSPATQESFGIAALEARCSGLPVVARTQSGSGEFVTSGVDGVLGRSDAELVDALVALVSDPDALAAMRERCRAMPDLGWDRAVARNAELYDAAAAVVGRPPVGAAR
jgi:glycosyltransferase involved in cell wall biosynthesis